MTDGVRSFGGVVLWYLRKQKKQNPFDKFTLFLFVSMPAESKQKESKKVQAGWNGFSHAAK